MRITLTLLTLLMISCNNIVKDNEIINITGYDRGINSNSKQIEFEDINIVPLETTDKNLISNITNIKIVDSMIFIHNHDKLLCFDINGKFLTSFGEKGNGADEYININSYFIDEKRKRVNIVDDYNKKIISFKLDGTYIEKEKYNKNIFKYSRALYPAKNGKLKCKLHIQSKQRYYLFGRHEIRRGDKTTLFPCRNRENDGISRQKYNV